MERVDLPKESKNPTFIGAWLLQPTSICDELIAYFEKNQEKQAVGELSGGVDKRMKDCVDITVAPREVKLPGNEFFEAYFFKLYTFYSDYVKQWPFLETFVKKIDIGHFNLQRYHSGQHFGSIHTERSGLSTLHRVYAWMTYLNDVNVEDGGSTSFTHYGLDIQPRKGLTLIWPAEWTHAHKGNVLKANSKYIITGWMNFSE